MKQLFVSYERTLYFPSKGISEKSIRHDIFPWKKPIQYLPDLEELAKYIKDGLENCINIEIINWRRVE